MKRTGPVQHSYLPPDDALAQRVSSSAAVSLGGVLFRTFVTIGSTAALARLLSPADFGLLTMASLVTEFAALFSNFGIGAILIQVRRSSRLQYDTAFWFAAALGAVLMAAVWLFAVFAGLFFDDPQVGNIVRVLSVLFLLEELTVVHSAVLNRLLKFKLEVAIQMGQLLLRVGATIALAWLGWGVWSLVLGSLVGSVFRTAALWLAVPYRPRARFHWPLVAGRIRTSLSYLGSAVLGYLNNNLDYLVVGRRFGASDLGYYQAAYSLSDELRNRISMPLQRVLFPAYSLIQNELDRFRSGVLTAARLLAIIVLPLGIGMSITAPELVLILYGERWIAAIPLLQALAINGAVRSIFSMVGSIYAARDRMHIAFALNAMGTVITMTAIIIGAQWGPKGIAIAMLCTSFTSALAAHIALSYLDINLGSLLRAIAPPLLSAILMGAILHAIRPTIEANIIDTLPRLLFFTTIGAAIYIFTVAVISRATARMCLQMMGRFASWR